MTSLKISNNGENIARWAIFNDNPEDLTTFAETFNDFDILVEYEGGENPVLVLYEIGGDEVLRAKPGDRVIQIMNLVPEVGRWFE